MIPNSEWAKRINKALAGSSVRDQVLAYLNAMQKGDQEARDKYSDATEMIRTAVIDYHNGNITSAEVIEKLRQLVDDG